MNASKEQFAEMQARMAHRYPEMVAEIDQLVARIAARVARLPAIRLLHRAWWEHSAAVIMGGEDETEQAQALRMIDYVQSVIASTSPAPSQAQDVSEEEWGALKSDITSLFQMMTLSYPMVTTAKRKADAPDLDMALEEFQVRAELLWVHVRGRRYHLHERQALLDTILPHSDVLQRLFGISAQDVVDGLDAILAKLTRGLQDLFVELEEVRDRTLARMEALVGEGVDGDVDDLHAKIFEDPDLRESSARIAGGLFGYDLFDVQLNTNLPRELLDELAYGPGEEAEFFTPGDFPGWPLRVWPVMKRPFIRLDDRIYCFDIFSLFDNFYRVLQRLIFRLAPEYKPTWNERQQALSEALPFGYLERLLPGGSIHRPVYYRWKAGDGPAQWHEADGVLAYDDHLFVIEIKAGAFTYTSPATDLPAHIASLQNLFLNPARQGGRFVDYLESADEVTIFDADHQKIGQLRRGDFRHVTIVAVTLDPFTELAARAQHLRQVGIDVGARPVWVLSIDDLRTYADLITNPLVFLHYAEQRIAAASSKLVDLDDELDHLGMYFSENQYARYADELHAKAKGPIRFNGYRSEIDEYFSAVLRGQPAERPVQKMPTRIAEIVQHLNHQTKPGRSMLASFLLDAAGDHRETIAKAVDQALDDHRKLGRVRPLSSYGEHAFTLFTWSPLVPRDAEQALSFTRDVVGQSGEEARLLIEIETGSEGEISDIHWAWISLSGLTAGEAARHVDAGRRLAMHRVAMARAQGKIGANAQCPCGSGKKYKKCHGRH